MPDLSPGSSWGPFRIEGLLGPGPAGVVYRALRTADSKIVRLKIFHDGIDEPTLRRFEDDARRMIGLGHPRILRVESVGREASRLTIASEYFQGRSLRQIGPRAAQEMADLLLQSARALEGAWMRLILHRNLKPENILVSDSGEVRVTDFGQFREPTPYWSPERRSGSSADLRGDLYSLGTIFKEILPAGEADLGALLVRMTRVETFERIQMVEDVLSALEGWMARHPRAASSPPPPPRLPDPVAPPPPTASSAPAFPAGPDDTFPGPALAGARAEMVRTLEAVTRRTISLPVPPGPLPRAQEASAPLPAPPLGPPPPPPAPSPRWENPPPGPPEPPPPPRPAPMASGAPAPASRTSARRAPSSSGKRVRRLVWLGLAAAILGSVVYGRYLKAREFEAIRKLQEEGRLAEAKKSLEDQVRKDQASAREKQLLEKIRKDEWAQAQIRIRALDQEGKAAEALKECERYLKQAGGAPPREAVELEKSLKDWTAAVSRAEQTRRYGADKAAADLLMKTGPDRRKDVEAILARWCEEDWTRTKTAIDAAITREDPYAAIAELERFLKKPHQGGGHRQDAEIRKLFFQADIDYAELADRIDTLKARWPADAAALIEGFLAKPHGGGSHREDLEKRMAELRESAKGILYSGQSTITRLAASPSGRRLAFASEGVKVLDTERRELLWTAPVKTLVKAVAFGGEERLFTGTSSKIQVWDLSEKKELRSLALPGSFLVGFAVTPDGKSVVAGLGDGSLITWDGSRDDPASVEKEAAPGVLALALAPDGTRLALAARDRTLRVRELLGGKELKWTGPPVTVSALALSPDGRRVLAGGASGMVTVWTAETGEAGPGVTGHAGSVTCAAFSPEGTMLATGGTDSKIQIASLQDGSILRTLVGHRGRISGIAFIPGALVSSGSDGSLRIWPLQQ